MAARVVEVDSSHASRAVHTKLACVFEPTRGCNGDYKTGALIIRIGFWGPLYYIYSKEPPPKKVLVNIQAPIVGILNPKP